MEDIIATQEQVEAAIEQLWVNFRKDGASRKTADYIKRRLDQLDKLWQEYQANHIELCGIGMRNHKYFIENKYESTQEKYSRVKTLIANTKTPENVEKSQSDISVVAGGSQDAPSHQQKPEEGSGSSKETQPEYQTTNSKTEDMFRKQASNFRAFHKSVSGMNLETVSEKWELEDLLRTLQSRWTAIDKLHWEIDSETGFSNDNKQYDSLISEYEVQYEKMKKAINSKLWSVQHREKITPQMDIPIFSGNYHQWVPFKDLFVEAIHSNTGLSNAQKMQFLKSKVRGEPEKLIQHLQISSSNYIICWDILNHRYDNEKLIFSSHMNILLSLPVMQQISIDNIKRIHDTTLECLNAIKNLGVDTSTWDPILVHLLAQKLDVETHQEYTESVKQPKKLPALQEFLDYLENKFTTMESSRRKQENPVQKHSSYQSGNQNKSAKFNKTSYVPKQTLASKNDTTKYWCPLCNSNEHGLYYCQQFLHMSPYKRRKTVEQLKVCQNCLYGHNGKACISEKKCRECDGSHNTLLHEACFRGSGMKQEPNQIKHNSHVSMQREIPETLLATAVIKVKAVDGNYHQMRVLLDQGSMTSLISNQAATLLGLPRQKCKGVISGVGAKESNCKGLLTITCQSVSSDFTFSTDVYIMKQLVNNLPTFSFTKPSWPHLDNIQLADPDFNISRPVDILLGADVYSEIILEGICRQNSNVPIAQQTRLGWILSGNVKTLQCNVVLQETEDLRRFWEIEDISESEEAALSAEDQYCVQFYKSTTKRLEDGRFEVRLPLKPDISEKLGSSKPKAISQFRSLERKFIKQEEIAKEYRLFMNEYLSLGHMKPAVGSSNNGYFLPHHCVMKVDSITSRLRVVFNGSAVTSSGKSLNDLMYRGPNLQADLQALLITWRQYQIAFTADIAKMYRCMLVSEEDQQYQKIVWRNKEQEIIQEYQLTTVTYGTKSAPFLAMMTLKQLASEEKQKLQGKQLSVTDQEKKYQIEAATVLQEKFYMDDLIHGCHSTAAALELQRHLISLLKSGGFHLRKWKANAPELLQDVDKNENFDFKQTESTKTLGLTWNPTQDHFTFQCKIGPTAKHTKRSLLSSISKLFDPLGWLSPISTKLKILFQCVWSLNIGWDDTLPDHIVKEWLNIKNDIQNIDQLQLPRWLQTQHGESIELHGFCDASTKAYSCVIYCKRNRENTEKSTVVLVVGKTRLVPSGKEISLPRLELLSAQLLSKLMTKVRQALNSYQITQFGWSDSMVTLGWLHGDPGRWKVFVANRVKQVTQSMPAECWRYVKSSENPADCASRGMSATQLKEHSLWWQGPAWLHTYQISQQKKQLFETNQDVKRVLQVNVARQNSENDIIYQLLITYNSLTKVVNVLARVLRILKNPAKRPTCMHLSVQEIKTATTMVVKYVQQTAFSAEIRDLEQGKQVSPKSCISNLKPYLDQGVLRVSGRLRNAHISKDMKCPIIIPKDGRFTELLVNHAHELTFHGGARLTLSFLRNKYWLISGNRVTKKWIRLCVKCRRHAPSRQDQLMGDLPEARCNPSRPFYHTGVDFTGFIMMKANKGRGIKTTKGYVAVFVCMATKAVHIELVSDLTSSSFIAALRRMAARRGTPGHMYSDNGTNFVGANNILQQEHEKLKQIFSNSFLSEITEMEIIWHFNAPSWPSAAGLMESGVRRLKFHLKRVIGEQKLTFEELSTVLAQIEGCLNSRPLCPLSENPDDDCLTPAHFLASGPVLTIFETERDLRTRWQLAQRVFQDVWNRWKNEYLTQLQTRSKWTQQKENIKLNDVVIIHDDNLPAGKWAMGRVVELHPGRDGLVRVVTLKTKTGYMKRPIIKLSPLPVHNTPNKDEQKSTTDPVEETRGEQKKPTRKSKFSFISVVLALTFIMISSSQAAYNVTNLRETQRLHFDKISDLKLIRDDWKLVVYYDLTPYWQGIAAFTNYTKQLDQACKRIHLKTIKSQCQVISLQLRHGYSELEYYNELLLSQHSRTRSRRMRGLINGVGYIANALFGVLDANFAEKYEQDISLVRENQQHLASLWKNQTSIIASEYDLLKRTEETFNQQQQIINKNFHVLEQNVVNLNNKIQDEIYATEFSLEALTASNMLQSLKTLQSALLDIITDIYHGRFNLHILTPDQLRKELNVVFNNLAPELTLPIGNLQDDLRNIYQLISVKARMTEDFMLFEIKLPIISRSSFELLKVIPIPEKFGEKMILVQPTAEYVALNIKKDAYVEMTEIEVRACSHNEQEFICRLHKPVYHLKKDDNLCKQDVTTTRCQTTTEICQNRWSELNMPNQYLYFCCNECLLKIICEDQISLVRLHKTGIITIGNGCIIKTSQFTVHAHKQDMSTMHTSFDILVPSISPVNSIINVTIPKIESIPTHMEVNQQIIELHNRIEAMKAETPLASHVSYHDVHHYAAIYVIVGLAVITVAATWIRRCCRRRAVRLPILEVERSMQPPASSAVPTSSSDKCNSVHVIRDKRHWQSESDIRAKNVPKAISECNADLGSQVVYYKSACALDHVPKDFK